MEKGTLTRVDARFYLAKNLRMYDHEYARSLEVLSPLMDEFPAIPSFSFSKEIFWRNWDARTRPLKASARPANFRRVIRFAIGTCVRWPRR